MNITSTKIKENKKLDGFYLEWKRNEENTKSLYEITTYYKFIILFEHTPRFSLVVVVGLFIYLKL